MKNKVKHLLYLTLLLLPASFLASFSVPATTPATGAEATVEPAYGGAYVVFAGKFGGDITRKEIESNTEVKVEGCAKGSRIFQFTLCVTKNGKTKTLTNQSNILTGEMIAQLKSLSKGDSFEFQNTKAYLPNSKDVVDVHGRKFIVV
ncbi:MAG: hypothetical protein DYG98_11640 [Haliscomenobacteraceae bacterium CHB4]|nr:hypothetical protein [Haliscomenobacteraceae bacterium CHB4]